MTHLKYLKFLAIFLLLNTSVGASSPLGEQENSGAPGAVPATTPGAREELGQFMGAVRNLRFDDRRIQEALASGSPSIPHSAPSSSQVPHLPQYAQDAGFSSWEALLEKPQEVRRLARESFARGTVGFEDAIHLWVMLIRSGGEARQADIYEYATTLFQQGLYYERLLFWDNAMAMAEGLIGRDLRARFGVPQKEGATTQNRQHDVILGQSRAHICRFLDGEQEISHEVRDACVGILSYNRCMRLGLSEDTQEELAAMRRAIALYGTAPRTPDALSDRDLLTLARLHLQSYGLAPQDAASAQEGSRFLKAYLARKTLPAEEDFYAFHHVLERVIGQEGVPSDLYAPDAAKFMERVMKKSVTLNDKSVPSWYFNNLLPLLETRLPAQKLMKRYALVGELTGSSMNPYAPLHMENVPQNVLYHCESTKDRLPAKAFAKAASLAQTLEDRNYYLLRNAQFLQSIADMRVLTSATPFTLHMDLAGTQEDFIASAVASYNAGAYVPDTILRATLFERAARDLTHAFRVGYDPNTEKECHTCCQILLQNASAKAEAVSNESDDVRQEHLAHAAIPAWEQLLTFAEQKKVIGTLHFPAVAHNHGALAYFIVGQSARTSARQKKAYFQRAVSLWENAFQEPINTPQAYYAATLSHHWLGQHLSGDEAKIHLREAADIWANRPLKELPNDEECAGNIAKMWLDATKAARDEVETLTFLEEYLDTYGYLFEALPSATLTPEEACTFAKHAHAAWTMAKRPAARLRLVVRVAPALPFLLSQEHLKTSAFMKTLHQMHAWAQSASVSVTRHQMNRPFTPSFVQMGKD